MTREAYYLQMYDTETTQILLAPELDAIDRSIIKLQADANRLKAAKLVLKRAMARQLLNS